MPRDSEINANESLAAQAVRPRIPDRPPPLDSADSIVLWGCLVAALFFVLLVLSGQLPGAGA